MNFREGDVMKIAIANDHGGFYLKTSLVQHLAEQGIEMLDMGTKKGMESVDYPYYAQAVSQAVLSKEADLGILCCGTGIGMSIAANKVPGIRAAVVNDVFSAKATREHNDSNILCLGERVVGEGLAALIADTWINAEFQGGRHSRRVEKIRQIEEGTR